jgi:hypothetical protein
MVCAISLLHVALLQAIRSPRYLVMLRIVVTVLIHDRTEDRILPITIVNEDFTLLDRRYHLINDETCVIRLKIVADQMSRARNLKIRAESIKNQIHQLLQNYLSTTKI